MAKLAIIGASEHQLPLILRAKEKGHITHVFAWEAGDVGESAADVFHPISITEKEAILELCRHIGIDGVCTIGTDLGNITAAYVAHHMNLPGNTPECIEASTNKAQMRRVLFAHNCPCPQSIPVRPGETLSEKTLSSLKPPLIVKPADRSGSRGITKLESLHGLSEALDAAFEVSFQKVALIEEFAEGREFSIEGISRQGKHHLLAVTEKFTTGAPHFIEIGHLQPARITPEEKAALFATVQQALDALGVQTGASHSELKMDNDGTIRIIEIASRMGGDCIGSDLTHLSTGIDFVGAVIDTALGKDPNLTPCEASKHEHAAVRFSFNEQDTEELERFAASHPSLRVRNTLIPVQQHEVTDSSGRFGCSIIAFDQPLDEVNFGLW